MNKQTTKASEVFKTYLAQIDGIKDGDQAHNWKMKVYDSLVLYLGNNALLIKRFGETYFNVSVKRAVGENRFGSIDYENDSVYKPERKQLFKDLLAEIINYIEQNGVQDKGTKTNLFGDFTSKEILIYGLPSLLTICGLVFWLGWFVGATQKEREIMKIELQLKDTTAKCVQYRGFVEMQKQISESLSNGFQEAQDQNKLLHMEVDSLTNLAHKQK